MIMASAAASSVVFAVLSFCTGFARQTDAATVPFRPTTPPIALPKSIQTAWAQSSPYFPAGAYVGPPPGCQIDQVHILQRHGARFPTSGTGEVLQAAAAKLQSATEFLDPSLDFLKTFVYDLGLNDLVTFGAAESFDAGHLTFQRYPRLASQSNLPFVRADSSQRVVFSATNWTAGFTAASGSTVSPFLNVIQDTANRTLDANGCPNAGDGEAEELAWGSIFVPPIQERLNAAAPGANLSLIDVAAVIMLCPFETVAKETPSPFCALFDQAEFDAAEYLGDLGAFYGTGFGQALGPVQGVGYVNELIARLTDSPVQDQTQTNHTLDGSPTTFPLNRSIYADFSHDSLLVAVYSALGLFRQPQPLDPTSPDPFRAWVASKLVPFAGRLVTERLSCSKAGRRSERFVRMFVNDALQDLAFCGAARDGLCTLGAFVASQGFAASNGGGLFEECFT